MLPTRHRLRTQLEFALAVRGSGRARAGSRLLVVHANRTDSRAENPPRVGFVVSKAVGGAVVRNRVKRQLRAASRPLVAELPTGVDLVVRAQPAASEASYQTLAHELMSLSHKAVRQLRMSA